jgi:cell division septum initiation protein DivIVA
VADQQNSPFARVSNGYDPKQVAAFAAEALSWKKELVALRSEVSAAAKLVERYESVIGSIEEVEREAEQMVAEAERRAAGLVEDAEVRAAKIVEEAEHEAARILEMAQEQDAPVPVETPEEPPTPNGEAWLTPEPTPDEMPDPVEQIFEPIEEIELPETDLSLERRAAGAANLWKRRGIVAPSE